MLEQGVCIVEGQGAELAAGVGGCVGFVLRGASCLQLPREQPLGLLDTSVVTGSAQAAMHAGDDEVFVQSTCYSSCQVDESNHIFLGGHV